MSWWGWEVGGRGGRRKDEIELLVVSSCPAAEMGLLNPVRVLNFRCPEGAAFCAAQAACVRCDEAH